MRIHAYVLREWLGALLLALGATLGIILLFDLLDNLEDFLSQRASAAGILHYYGLVCLRHLPEVLPLAVLLSILFSLGRLHRNHETTALRAAGVGLWQLTRSVQAGGLLLAALLLALSGEIVPRATEQAARLRAEWALQAAVPGESPAQSHLIYHDQGRGQLWQLESYEPLQQRVDGLVVSFLDDAGNESRRIAAKTALYDDRARRWQLEAGREVTFAPDGRTPVRVVTFDEAAFEELDRDPELMRLLQEKPRDLSLTQLRRVLGAVDGSAAEPFRARAYVLLASPVNIVAALALAIPFAVSGVRVSPMANTSKALGLFFAFYLLARLGELLGGMGVISPMLAGTLPAAVLLILAILFTRKLT